MTTKPKAKKFRIRRSESAARQEAGATEGVSRPPQDAQAARPASGPSTTAAETPHVRDTAARPPRATAQTRPPRNVESTGATRPAPGASDAPQSQTTPETTQPSPPQTRTGEVASAAQVSGETDIEKIRQEGLTGRQLRMARRMAQKHGLAPTSDFDAVRLLRKKGIDPFQRANMLELVVGNNGETSEKEPQVPARANAVDPATTGGVKLPQTVGRKNR